MLKVAFVSKSAFGIEGTMNHATFPVAPWERELSELAHQRQYQHNPGIGVAFTKAGCELSQVIFIL
ncbi:uncharacterized protein N7503_000288 [Penicillium pulvis]|uniref:uncharacterized protein n=1 Tax=Penicillium pulvis TaxID=1562058 RepID=UPI002547ADD8|nr:uncharacterized protein N7503_000288 [Penicillium pulvis]KAJ5813538.1 hypothetical protein N7503_000288 [Penicillium pulvis]